MGLSDKKLHRFLSVPDNILLCKSEKFDTVEDLKLKPRDSGRITVRNKSFKFHMRSSYSCGSDLKLPERLRFKNCASDIDSEDIKGGHNFTCQTFDNEIKRKMTVLRDSRNRRQALGNIFEDTSKEDFDNMLSAYQNRRNSEIAEDMPADDFRQHRRGALADIFHDVSEDDLERLSVYHLNTDNLEMRTPSRRPALPDIFANISREQLQSVIRKCQQEIESRSTKDHTTDIPRRCRRCGKANIFDDVDQNDIQNVLQIFESNIINQEFVEQHAPLCRRFALADIFQDISEDDLWRISSMFEEEVDDDNQCEKHAVDHRRQALADIFSDVNENDLLDFLSEFCDDFEEQDSSDDNFSRSRRMALGNIFSDIDNSDLQSFMSKYGTCLEQMTVNDKEEGV